MANPARDFFDNWRTYDASTLEKIRLSIKNTRIKATTASSCCGNYGEPGC